MGTWGKGTWQNDYALDVHDDVVRSLCKTMDENLEQDWVPFIECVIMACIEIILGLPCLIEEDIDNLQQYIDYLKTHDYSHDYVDPEERKQEINVWIQRTQKVMKERKENPFRTNLFETIINKLGK